MRLDESAVLLVRWQHKERTRVGSGGVNRVSDYQPVEILNLLEELVYIQLTAVGV